MLNLNTQTAYRDLRDKRAQLRKIGKPVTGMELVTSLSRYSERGEAYVKTLKGIMHGNELRVADNARLRDEPITLLVNVDPGEKHAVKADLLEMQNSGELAEFISAMGLRE